MFKFNFNSEEKITEKNEEDENHAINQEFGCVNIDQLQSSVRCFEGTLKDLSGNLDEEIDRLKFELDGTDLVPNVYEGGFKTWECSHDLVDYLKTIPQTFEKITTVLEIGCGSGLPGMELNKHRQFQVDFQDFNREVVEQTGRQLKKEKRLYNNHLFFGDWGDLINIIPSKHYDLLLTSETIYNTGNYGKLVRLFDHALTSQGIIYLAAKIYYFGVQGGVRQFEEYLTKTGLFNSRVIRVIDTNVKREILEITRSIPE